MTIWNPDANVRRQPCVRVFTVRITVFPPQTPDWVKANLHDNLKSLGPQLS